MNDQPIEDHYRLSHQQQRFCDEYLTHFNAFKAAITAGYSANTASKGALLHVPKIQLYLKQAMAKTANRLEITHDMILRELAKVAFANMGNYYDEYACLKRLKDLTVDEKAAIAYYDFVEIQDGEGYRVGTQSKIKLHNKMSALDKIARHLNFYGTVGVKNQEARIKSQDQDGAKSKEQGVKTNTGVRESAVIDRTDANLPMDYPEKGYAYGEEPDELEGIDPETLALLDDVNIGPGTKHLVFEEDERSNEQGARIKLENQEARIKSQDEEPIVADEDFGSFCLCEEGTDVAIARRPVPLLCIA
jgi:phage terminase small subunit